MKMTINRSVTINLDNDDYATLMKARRILEDILDDGMPDLEDNDVVLIQYGGGSHKYERKDVAKAFTALDTLI